MSIYYFTTRMYVVGGNIQPKLTDEIIIRLEFEGDLVHHIIFPRFIRCHIKIDNNIHRNI